MTGALCPICRGTDLEVFFEAAGVPVFCNVLHETEESARAAPTADVRLTFCRACAMIHNAAFDPDDVAYTAGYETSLHFSPRFAEHARELAARLVARFGLRRRTIVEIGCGQGEFLALLCEAGDNRGVGFDRAHRPDATPASAAIRIVAEDFTAAHADLAADLICCRHVLEHVADPRELLAAVRQAARRSGAAVFFEVPNAMFTLRDLGIWDVIYEHCSYFTRPSLQRLFDEVDLPASSIDTAFGEQFLCAEAAGSDRLPPVDAAEVEAVADLVGRFAEQHAAKLAHWNETLARFTADGLRVALWGAGSKGVTFLNAVEGGERVGAVIDLNPRKHGRHVPVTGQVVEPPASLARRGADVVLVANPIYEEEIRRECARLGLSPRLAVL